MTLLHATCVAIGGRAVLITGPSGAGKSDLALRLIDRGAILVSDDQVALSVEAGQLLASAPKTIAGRMEVRGVGIVAMEHVSPMPVALLLDLDTLPERLPDLRMREICGLKIPVAAVAPLEASTPIKVERLLETLDRP